MGVSIAQVGVGPMGVTNVMGVSNGQLGVTRAPTESVWLCKRKRGCEHGVQAFIMVHSKVGECDICTHAIEAESLFTNSGGGYSTYAIHDVLPLYLVPVGRQIITWSTPRFVTPRAVLAACLTKFSNCTNRGRCAWCEVSALC
jgi:hypothetical protein